MELLELQVIQLQRKTLVMLWCLAFIPTLSISKNYSNFLPLAAKPNVF
jgi:hypothetical protein